LRRFEMERLSEGAIELSDIEVFNNCSYSCYMNLADALNEIEEYRYINIQKQTYECKISGFYINKDEIQFMVAFQDEDDETWYEIGETHKEEDLFLTREEAEKALKGEEL